MQAVDFGGLRICFLAGTLAKGGAERQLYYMLRALRQSGARPRVLCFHKGEYWQSAIEELGVPVVCLGRSKLGRIREIIRDLRADRPDILQSAHFYTNPYVQVAARVVGVQEIGAIRCDVVSEVSGNHRWLRRLSLRTLRAVAANSRAAIRSAQRFGVAADRLRFLPNVVDVAHFRPASTSHAGAIRVFGAGRLNNQKRFDRLLRVVSRVRDNLGREIRVCIAGDGPFRKLLEDLAARLGFRDSDLEFAGHVDDMRSLYQNADVFMLTSAYEGTPNVVLEAMAAGLPVMATRVGDVAELIESGVTGFLAGPDEEDVMVNTLQDLVRDPELCARVGRAARNYVAASHSVQNLPEYLHALYGGVLVHESVSVAHS